MIPLRCSDFKLSYPWLALTPHAGIPPPPPPLLPPLEREATADRMLRWREPAANGGNGGGRAKNEGGEGRRIQLKKNDITCAAREEERERERGGWSESEQGETVLDGLEQMWMKEREREIDGQEEKMRKTERGSIFIDRLVT